MIAEREHSLTEVVRPGVTDEELARIVAAAGFGPAVRGGESTLAADDHPLAVAARIEATATVLRAVLLLIAMLAVGGVAILLV